MTWIHILSPPEYVTFVGFLNPDTSVFVQWLRIRRTLRLNEISANFLAKIAKYDERLENH